MKTSTAILTGLLATTLLTLSSVNTYIIDKKLNQSIAHADYLIKEHTLEIANFENKIKLKDIEVDRLNLALATAFKDNQVIQTLLNQDMTEWTHESVLGMRDKLASLPYGSWFESGHYVTGAFGSTTLSGTYWGKNGHKGVDIKPNSGNNDEIVRSAIAGRVITWGRNDRLFGNYIVIESLDGQFQIKLAHLSSIAIFTKDGNYDLHEGMEFSAGTRLARMGNTGNSTGHHLHIEYFMLESNTWRLLNASAILDYIGE